MKRLFKILLIVLLLCITIFSLYCNNTGLANKKTVNFYNELKETLQKRGYKKKLLVISTKRFKWHNDIQTRTSSAAKKSRHLAGDAIDFLVFDVSDDGKANSFDVNIFANILDSEIVRSAGGIGTNKTKKDL